MNRSSHCCFALTFVGAFCCFGIRPSAAQTSEPVTVFTIGVHDYVKGSDGKLADVGQTASTFHGLSDTKEELQLTVRIYNSARVAVGDLHVAEDRAARIFRQAKITTVWEHVLLPDEVHDHAKSEAWNPADLHLRLWTRASVGLNTYGEDTLGFRVSTEKSTAIIIADEIRNRAAAAFTDPGNLLGLVMAHEMGHLLLRSAAHSVEGIMQGRLPTDLKDRRRTLLVFTREQANSMQSEVRRRMAVKSARDIERLEGPEQTKQGFILFSPEQAQRIRAQVIARTISEPSQTSVVLSTGNLSAASSQIFAHQPSSSAVPEECLNIHLYNLVGVSSETLDHATQDAERVLATAGVNLVCWRVPADAPEAHIIDLSVPTGRMSRKADPRPYLVVIIERGFPDNYLPDELGYALPDAQTGVNATVFYDRIERLHKSAEIDLPTLLGHAMAHEIGHVLLGTTEHSTAGIMKARWSKADFEVAGLRFMTFTAMQGVEVLRRRTELVATVTVRSYDYVAVPSQTLVEAEREASRNLPRGRRRFSMDGMRFCTE